MKDKSERKNARNSNLVKLHNSVIRKESAIILIVSFVFLFLILFFSNIRIDKNINHTLLLWLTLIHTVFFYLFLVIINGLYPFKANKKITILAAIIPGISILLYSYTFFFLKNYAHYILTYYGMNLLFLFSYSIFCLLCIKRIPELAKRVFGIIYAFFLFISIVCSLTYLIYFLLYGHEIDDYAILAILGTNIGEIKGYLLTMFLPKTLFFGFTILFFVLIILVLLIQRILDYESASIVFQNLNEEEPFSRIKLPFFSSIRLSYRNYSFGVLFGVILLIPVVFWLYRTGIFPFDRYESLLFLDGGPLSVFRCLDKNIKKNVSTIQIINAQNTQQAETIVLVIGESANRDYMSSFNLYMKDNTTPWERENRNNPCFYFFDNGYANFNSTVIALSQALTNANQYNNTLLEKSISIIDIANITGYKTYFFSMQERSSIDGAGITIIANQSNSAKWISGYDEKVLNLLKDVSPYEKNFVIIHLQGSHYLYSDRYPKNFVQEHSLTLMEPNKDYKYSLLYTDEVLKRIFQYCRRKLNLVAMVYFSDHGEDTKYLHVNNPFYYSMVRIPLWIYLSQNYRKNNSNIAKNLKLHQKSIFTNDLIFDTLHGLLRCESNYYNPKFDLTNSAYNISLQEAVTLHGKRKIADDPAWKEEIVRRN